MSIGRSVQRIDAIAKVTGQAIYTVDVSAPGMLHGVVVRSTRAHARIVEIRTERARAMQGVSAVITAGDLEGLFPRFGHIVPDHPILAIDKVRYYGEPVALVVADSVHAASDAAEAVRVRYEDLPVMIEPDEALEPDAPLIHTESYGVGDRSFEEAHSDFEASNVAHTADLDWGDVDSALNSAHLVVETTARYPMLYAYAMEPYNAVAQFDEGVLEVVSTAQHPFQVREDLARIFDLPLNRVRVRSPLLGGGYGSKSYTKVEPLAAAGAWAAGRPVKVVLDVEGAIHTTRADSAVVTVRSGFSADGDILARDIDITFNTGAYADNGPLVLTKSVMRASWPVPHSQSQGPRAAVFTNTVPSSSYRGFGAPQGNLAGETNLDQAADQLGLDPADVRRRNLVGPGSDTSQANAEWTRISSPISTSWRRCGLGRRAACRSWDRFGCSASDAGAFPVSTASDRLLPTARNRAHRFHRDGSGSWTALGLIAARKWG